MYVCVWGGNGVYDAWSGGMYVCGVPGAWKQMAQESKVKSSWLCERLPVLRTGGSSRQGHGWWVHLGLRFYQVTVIEGANGEGMEAE